MTENNTTPADLQAIRERDAPTFSDQLRRAYSGPLIREAARTIEDAEKELATLRADSARLTKERDEARAETKRWQKAMHDYTSTIATSIDGKKVELPQFPTPPPAPIETRPNGHFGDLGQDGIHAWPCPEEGSIVIDILHDRDFSPAEARALGEWLMRVTPNVGASAPAPSEPAATPTDVWCGDGMDGLRKAVALGAGEEPEPSAAPSELARELRSAVTYMRDAIDAVRRHDGPALAEQYALRVGEIEATLEKAAALTRREPEGLRFPRNAGGLLKIHMLEAVAERADEIGHAGGAPLPACHAELERVGHVLLAAESLHNEGIAQDPLTEVVTWVDAKVRVPEDEA